MATGTLAPDIRQTVLIPGTVAGTLVPANGAKINTYLAGTSTPVATYTDVALSVPNANPIVADGNGQWYAYLTPGVSYKFVVTTSVGGAIYTQDNVTAVPISASQT